MQFIVKIDFQKLCTSNRPIISHLVLTSLVEVFAFCNVSLLMLMAIEKMPEEANEF